MQSYMINHPGSFDIIGDIHGCFLELVLLLEKLGYQFHRDDFTIHHEQGRALIFVGDMVDRGINSPDVLRLYISGSAKGNIFCVNGNHDDKLRRYLLGNNVSLSNGLSNTVEQLKEETESFKSTVLSALSSLKSHLIFDSGKLVVTHAAIKEKYFDQDSKKIRAYCMYGPTTGVIDQHGFPERLPWAEDYTGKALIVYGHQPTKKPCVIGRTINIDTGCVFGGKLTAYRYPEMIFESVPALKAYD